MNSSTAVRSVHPPIKNSSMELIPGGKFSMGSEGWGEYESPVHEVFVKAFQMDQCPVTNERFSDFIKQTRYKTTAEIFGSAMGYKNGQLKKIEGLYWRTYFTEDRKDHPVVLISWHDATEFAKWCGKRLPTEAEWEKAARGGLNQKLYPWGNDAPNSLLCNFGKETSDLPKTTAVKTYPANGYGLYDMAGNVWNWCSDWFSENYYPQTMDNNSSDIEVRNTKIRRGASFNIIQPFRLRCANRGAFDPNSFAINIGFRCVKDVEHE